MGENVTWKREQQTYRETSDHFRIAMNFIGIEAW
jgi:hypothetical protein